MTPPNAGTQRAALALALTPATHTTHAHSYAAKFWATKNFAAYGLRGTWGSIR